MRDITADTLNQEVLGHLKNGNKIQAIKSLREVFPGASLKATKEFVESIEIKRSCPCCGHGTISNELFQNVLRDAKANCYANHLFHH